LKKDKVDKYQRNSLNNSDIEGSFSGSSNRNNKLFKNNKRETKEMFSNIDKEMNKKYYKNYSSLDPKYKYYDNNSNNLVELDNIKKINTVHRRIIFKNNILKTDDIDGAMADTRCRTDFDIKKISTRKTNDISDIEGANTGSNLHYKYYRIVILLMIISLIRN